MISQILFWNIKISGTYLFQLQITTTTKKVRHFGSYICIPENTNVYLIYLQILTIIHEIYLQYKTIVLLPDQD